MFAESMMEVGKMMDWSFVLGKDYWYVSIPLLLIIFFIISRFFFWDDWGLR